MDIEKLFTVRDTSDKNNLLEIKKYVNKLVADKKINMLEFTYIMNFIKNNCSIVNISWLLEIFNRLEDKELNKLLIKCFNIIGEQENKLKLNLISIKLLFEKSSLKFTRDQLTVIEEILNFLPNCQERSYGLYGYAGTGKTTVCAELIGTLALHKYVKTIALTAPTNMAVDVLKSKFIPFLQRMSQDILKINMNNGEDVLDKLVEHGIKIDFITIHKLLNYESDMSIEGEKIFINKGKSKIKDYELVIIDECSMVPLNMVDNIFKEIREIKTGDNYQKTPKVIFSGDKAQLPPVNYPVSPIFLDKKENYQISDYLKEIKIKEKTNIDLEIIIKDIINMKTYTMTEIVRNKIGNVINLCYNIRKWVEREIERPTPRKFQNNGVYIYKLEKGKSRLENEWFKNYIKYITDEKTINNSNIMLTWTNRQTDEYNNEVRKIVYKKEKLNKYEIGDILMFRNFYNIENNSKEIKKKKKSKYGNSDNIVFYTSTQIKVMDLDIITKSCYEFIDKIDLPERTTPALRTSIERQVKLAITIINKETTRNYKTYECQIQKLSEYKVNSIPDTYTIYVLHDEDIKKYNKEKEFIADVIKKLRNMLMKLHRENMMIIDNKVIKPIWKQWSKNMIEPFANVDYAVSCSSHRSQGSTYYNVFIDVDDILNNPDSDEGRRCLYTAVTRASNEIHLLIP